MTIPTPDPVTVPAVRRRRGCNNCGGRFTTFERVQLRDLIVVKRDGRKAVFERDKLRRSLKVALQKRPVSEDLMDLWMQEFAAAPELLWAEHKES